MSSWSDSCFRFCFGGCFGEVRSRFVGDGGGFVGYAFSVGC